MARRTPFLPRPPQPKNMVEFIVELFAVTVATIMVLVVVGGGLLILTRDDFEAGPVITAVTTLMNTIISALVGYIAGRGQGKSEVLEEQKRNGNGPA
jgi:hypothetical protein